MSGCDSCGSNAFQDFFDVAKGGEKNGYFKKSRCYIFQDLKLSINSKPKGENMEN